MRIIDSFIITDDLYSLKCNLIIASSFGYVAQRTRPIFVYFSVKSKLTGTANFPTHRITATLDYKSGPLRILL